MSLANHNYYFVSEQDAFYEKSKITFELIKGAAIEHVYAIWDNIDKRWFYDAPILVQTSAGILSVHVKSGSYIAIGWNDIFPLEKISWFDEIQRKEIGNLNWNEDLEWREYHKVHSVYGEQIERILFHPDSEKWGIGIGLKCRSGKCLWIYDAGDIISAKVE